MKRFFIVGVTSGGGFGQIRIASPETARGYDHAHRANEDAAAAARKDNATLAVVEVLSVFEPHATVVVEQKLPADVP